MENIIFITLYGLLIIVASLALYYGIKNLQKSDDSSKLIAYIKENRSTFGIYDGVLENKPECIRALTPKEIGIL